MVTIYIIFYTFLLFTILQVNTLYLNNIQQQTIKTLILNNKLSLIEREKINNVLFEAYKECAHKKAYYFKYIHKYKCRNIHINDLKSAAEFGLMKASKHYNGNSSFYYYSSLHIKNELLTALTNYNSVAPISKTTLRKGFSGKNPKFSLDKYYSLQNKLNIIYESIKSPEFLSMISMNSVNVLENIVQEEEKENLWNNVLLFISSNSTSNSLMKEIFVLKYNKEFKKIRSDKEISQIIGLSKGNIQMKLTKIKQLLRDKFTETKFINNLY
jgi:RNA polymerase sigma factor (sigma-70 family)